MKTKIFALFAAMMLLVGTTAMAQSDDTKNTSTTETTLKGDVNADGVVDVADIAAVIAVMHELGTAPTKFYWYAGWTEPTAENIATIINEEYPVSSTNTTMNKAGGVSAINNGFSISNFFASITTNRYNIADETRENSGQKANYYIVVPNNMGIYSSNLATVSVLPTFTKHSEFDNHIVYKSIDTSRNINAFVIY